MSVRPLKIERLKSTEDQLTSGCGLRITWSSGTVSELDSTKLRTNCPCATCEQKRGSTSHEKPLTAGLSGKGRSRLSVISKDIDKTAEIDLQEVYSVGNYAVGIRWGDGHSSGIYMFSHLLELGK